MKRIEQPRTGIKAAVMCSALLLAWGASVASQDTVQALTQSRATPAALMECNGGGGKSLARTELFFGLARPDGSRVSLDEFQQFLDQEVTPRFPAGLTLLGGDGQFRNANGTTIKESSKLLILLYPYERDASRKIESIRAAYAKAFKQESVLRVDGISCVS